MIFAGHMQTTFILLLGMICMHFLLNYPPRFKKSLYFFGIILLGFILAAPQILPTILFSHYSERGFMNSYQYVVSFLFNIRDLVGFASSSALGTPRYGTYGGLAATGNRIYWENTPYMGELFILTLFISSIYYFFVSKKQSLARIFLLLSLVFILFAFGGDSPFYFVFALFPFNMFRATARYLLASVFFLVLYAAFIFKKCININRYFLLFIYCALVVNSLVLIYTALNYHVFIDSHILFDSLTKNKTLEDGRYFTFGGNEMWSKLFSTDGWKTKKDINDYLFLNAALLPNSNLIEGSSSFDVYTGGLTMRRNEYIMSIITDSLTELTQKQETPDAGLKLENFLQLYGIKTIITLQPLYIPDFTPVKVEKKDDMAITFMQNQTFKNNLFYVPSEVKSLTYLEDAENEIASQPISEQIGFAEGIPTNINQSSENANFQILKNDDHYLKSIAQVSEKRFIVAKKGWYPEWHLFIDGKESTIYKTNMMHMGFYIPGGRHTVEFVYIPTSFYIGIAISLIGIGGVAIFLYLKRKLVRS